MTSATHGVWCNTRTFPTTCKYCKQSVFYFHCDCNSRVFFDDLGPPWPEHHCQSQTTGARVSPPPPGKLAQSATMRRVRVSAQSPNYGLMPGTIRASDAVMHRVKATRSRPRETMRIDPIGTEPETLTGRVVEVHRMDLTRRLGIERRSLGANLVENRFPDLKAIQITVLVDDLDIDPDAEDLLSYTFWCKVSPLSESVKKDDIAHTVVTPVKILGIETLWLAESVEIV